LKKTSYSYNEREIEMEKKKNSEPMENKISEEK